jgi:hypothetical protein
MIQTLGLDGPENQSQDKFTKAKMSLRKVSTIARKLFYKILERGIVD